jgi:hypothetical protein
MRSWTTDPPVGLPSAADDLALAQRDVQVEADVGQHEVERDVLVGAEFAHFSRPAPCRS